MTQTHRYVGTAGWNDPLDTVQAAAREAVARGQVAYYGVEGYEGLPSGRKFGVFQMVDLGNGETARTLVVSPYNR